VTAGEGAGLGAGRGGGPSPVEPFDDLERWASEARAREAAEARVRARWLRTQAEEGATLRGVLVDLAERAVEVSVRTSAGRVHAGPILAVGRDFVAVRTPAARLTLVALAAVASVHVPPLVGGGGGDAGEDEPGEAGREGAGGRGGGDGDDEGDEGAGGEYRAVPLADVLAQAAGERPRVAVEAGAQRLVGDLRTVGTDMLTVRVAAGLAHVALQSVLEISFFDSG
jgi:hypothetical protein